MNKLLDAHAPKDEMILEFAAGAGVKEIQLDLPEAAKLVSVLTEWIASEVSDR